MIDDGRELDGGFLLSANSTATGVRKPGRASHGGPEVLMTLRQPVSGPTSATVPYKTEPLLWSPSLCASPTTDFRLTITAWIKVMPV